MADRLTQDLVGALAYSIEVDGEILDTVTADHPIEYLHGYDNIVPGLENALDGLSTGDDFDVTVAPEDAYGEYDDENIEEIPRDDFEFDEEGMELMKGLEVEMMDEDGDIIEGTIIELRDETVMVDFNPPLAGKTIRYKGTVVNVREATEEELEWGYPESLLDELFGTDDDDFDADADA